MKRITVIFFILINFFGVLSASATTINLQYWGFNINGDVHKGGDEWGNDVLPSFFDDSGFDWESGLDTLSIEFDPGVVGEYSVLSYFDHEIDEMENTFFNEYGTAVGMPAMGQSWEIDQGGHLYGDITDHLLTDKSYRFSDNKFHKAAGKR